MKDIALIFLGKFFSKELLKRTATFLSKNSIGIHYMFKYLAIASLVSVTGCASITGEKLQPVSVQTIQDNKEVAGVGCTLTNDAGKWFVTSPGSVTVHKSTGDLAIDCSKDGNIVGHETLVSKSNGAVWGNILAGGGIGYIIDRNTGAGFNYPDNITIVLRKVGEAVGLVVPASTLTAPTGVAEKTVTAEQTITVPTANK